MIPLIERNVPLALQTTFKTGGQAAFFVSVSNNEDLQFALSFAFTKNVQIFILGGGSNVLISDQGLNGLVIKMQIKGITFHRKNKTVFLEACAGEVWDDVVSYAVSHGFWGIENLSHIPGSAGAAPVQNIGAYGVELKDVLCWVEIMDAETLQSRRISVEECEFSYRESVFKKERGKRFVITRICLELKEDGKPTLQYADLAGHFCTEAHPSLFEIREAVGVIRRRKFPDLSTTGTAGSFFKNPIISVSLYKQISEIFPSIPGYVVPEGVKIPIAFILEQLGWRGYRRGCVGVHDRHALVLVSDKGARSADIEKLAEEIVRDIKEKTGITLEREVLSVIF